MPLDANTYGTVARVQSMVGDLVQGRTFTDTSTPTLAQVEAFLDDIASKLNMTLAWAEYTIPVSSSADAAAFNYLRFANSAGAAAAVLSALPLESYAEPDREQAQNRRQYLDKQLSDAIKRIDGKRLPATKDASQLAALVIGSEKDSEGDTNKPIFTRSISDFPSSRSLTE